VIGRGSAGVRLFDVGKNEHVVSAVRIDEQEEPENEAEEAIVEEMVARGSGEVVEPQSAPTRDDEPDEGDSE
jgi:DNA gyrase subunit A